MTTGRLVLVFLTGVSCCLHALLASILALFHLFIVHLMLPFSHSFLPPPPPSTQSEFPTFAGMELKVITM